MKELSITAIIPNYNHAKYLHERINSVINQTHKPDEIIILDDSSNDSSQDIINEYVNANKYFVKWFNVKNSGSTFIQWNKGVSIANSAFIWIAESDDIADKFLLETLVKKMEADSEIVLSYCQSNRINENDEVTGTWKDYTNELEGSEFFESDFVMNGKEYINKFLIHRNTIPNASAVLFRKSVFDKIGGAPVHFKNNGDWLTWLKMLCFGKVAFVSKPLNYFRKHDKSVIAQIHQIKDSQSYKEKYDTTLRKEFFSFIVNNSIDLPTEVLNTNAYYISLDLGNKGLFNLNQGNFLSGWRDVIAASFYPKFQSGFIKKGLGIL
jgi:glycosyltransferase involved in cell wall biosynthesis